MISHSTKTIAVATVGALVVLALWYCRASGRTARLPDPVDCEVPPALCRSFDEWVDRVGRQGTKLTQADQLSLYALYKIATGSWTPATAAASSSSLLDPVRAAKDRSLVRVWVELNGSRTLATRRYIELAKLICSGEERKGDASDVDNEHDGASGFGVVTSQLASPLAADAPGSTPTVGDPDAVAAALAAASEDDTAALQRLAGTTSLANLADSHGVTPLMMAADRGSLGALRFLLTQHVSLDAVDADGATALHYAALCDQLEAVQALLQAGADPSTTDDDGDTAADITDSPDVVAALKNHLGTRR